MDNKRQMLWRPVTTACSILFGNLYSIMYGLYNEMVSSSLVVLSIIYRALLRANYIEQAPVVQTRRAIPANKKSLLDVLEKADWLLQTIGAQIDVNVLVISVVL